MTYVDLPIQIDGEQMVEDVFADMAARFPGWEPAAGNPETWLIRAIVSRLIVPLAELAADVPSEIFAQYGRQIVNVQPIEATPATGAVTVTMIDNAGYTLPAGTQMDIAATGSELVGFATTEDVTVPAGSLATAAGEVIIEAVEPGANGSDLAADPTLVDSLDFVASIDLVGATTGGLDAEDPDAYLSRLADSLQTLSLVPVISRDVEILARNIAGVWRAVALDGYNPADNTFNNERMVAVFCQDAAGQPCSAPVKAALASDLASRREANFVFNVEDPDYTTVDARFAIVVRPGFAQDDVEADVVAAIEDFLSPLRWGTFPPGSEREWLNQPTAYYQDLVTLVNNQEGVDRYTTLEWRIPPAAYGTGNLALTGPAPLPQPGVIAAI